MKIAGLFDIYAKRTGLQRYALAGGQTVLEGMDTVSADYANPVQSLRELFHDAPLGWLELPLGGAEAEESIAAAQRISELCSELIVCGIGGSILGTQAVYSALDLPGSRLRRVHMLDNVDPRQIQRISESINPRDTALCIVTKSGGTLESLAAFSHILSRMETAGLSREEISKRVVVIVGGHPSSLRDAARENSWTMLKVPATVGGRFSVFSPVGLFPLAFAGIDINELLSGAAKTMLETGEKPGPTNIPLRLAAAHHLLQSRGGCSQVLQYVYGDPLYALALWWRQLWAESLGKREMISGEQAAASPSPLVARGATDQHSQNQLYMDGPDDKVYCLLGAERWPQDPVVGMPSMLSERDAFRNIAERRFGELLGASMLGTRDALMEQERPVYELLFHDVTAEAVGAYMQFWMLTTAFAGMLYQVNPFDQPGVEISKKLTRKRL